MLLTRALLSQSLLIYSTVYVHFYIHVMIAIRLPNWPLR